MNILAVVIIIAIVISIPFFVFLNKGYYVYNGISRLNTAGKLQLIIMRTMVPVFGRVRKSLGFPKWPIRMIEKRSIETDYGAAQLTCYYPFSEKALLPVYVNFHGGGFLLGFPEQDDLLCRHFAHFAKCVVVNVDYVLAPEHPFPAAIMQSYEVMKWIAANGHSIGIDVNNIAVGGQSAGASITAAICLLAAKQKEFSIKLQILNYGWFDATAKDLSYKGKQLMFLFVAKILNFFKHLYLPNPADYQNELCSPLLAQNINGIAGALIITAGDDVLRKDGERYAASLRQAGTDVIYHEYPGANHAFTHFGPKQQAHEAWRLMASTLKSHYNNA